MPNKHDTEAFQREAAMGAYRIADTVLKEAEAKLLQSWGWRSGGGFDWWRHDGVDGPRKQGEAMTLLLEELDG